MFQVDHSTWLLPGHVSFIPLILSANMFLSTFIFPKSLYSFIFGAVLPISIIGLFLVIPQSFHVSISVEILKKHEVRTCWVYNLVLEIYNVLLYGEAIPPKILFVICLGYYFLLFIHMEFRIILSHSKKKKIQLEF